jgi:hypothetical protein
MNHKNPTQEAVILFNLQCGRTITPLDALKEVGCFRLGARIHQLKKAGHQIETLSVEQNGKRFAGYRLVQP